MKKKLILAALLMSMAVPVFAEEELYCSTWLSGGHNSRE